MRETLSDKTLEREISPLSSPAVNLANSIQENSDQEIHISKSTSKLFLEFYDFCNILNVYAEKRRLTNIHRNHWQKITRSIDKSLTEEIETEEKKHISSATDKAFQTTCQTWYQWVLKISNNSTSNSRSCCIFSFFLHIQSFSWSHLYSAMNACDILPLNQVLLSAICFLLLWPHLELGGCYPAVWWRWWIEPIRTDELEVFSPPICISRWGALFTLPWSLLSHSPKHCFHWRLLQHLQIDEPFQRHQLSFWG